MAQSDVEAINGVANLVFDLELHVGSVDGPLANIAAGSADCTSSPAGWCSEINDGTMGNYLQEVDKEEKAAFAVQFNANTEDYGLKPPGDETPPDVGRLIDLKPVDGPGMEIYGYPSVFDWPTGSNIEAGRLAGMGAGYVRFDSVNQYPAVGCVESPDSCNAGGEVYYLGSGPVAEGQINPIVA